MKKFKVGDKVRLDIKPEKWKWLDITVGKIYEVTEIMEDGEYIELFWNDSGEPYMQFPSNWFSLYVP